MDINKNFVGSKMNKSLDERLIPNGQYTDALNIRISSDEDGEAGSAENAKGNEKLTTISYNGSSLTDAKAIGVYEDGSKETIYWFVTSPTVDMILSYNVNSGVITYHVVSTTVLNFNEDYKITGVNLIDDLLFFTDNYNPPRRINVNSSYPQPISGVDQIVEDDISVIVKPPKNAPTIQLANTANKNNYIEDKFIRFAYRYRYANGEYSALSEFSDVAFQPGIFSLDYGSYEMLGMKNIKNAVNVTFNTGDERVKGIDLCFKQSNSNVVNVIDRFVKEDEGWGDNNDVSVDFRNQKIYTTIPNDELLRRFDNVPKLAKTQTSIGNRIFYGNYVDGYDIDPIINFDVSLKSEDIGYVQLVDNTENGSYNISGSTVSVNQSILTIDFTDQELIEGGAFYIDFNIVHSSFGDPSGTYVDGNEPENEYRETFEFIFPRDYTSVEDLATDQDFINAIQSNLDYVDADQGYSLTDLFYANIVNNSGWTEVGGGIDNDTGDFEISYSGNELKLQIPAIKYQDNSNPSTYAYEYFTNSSTTAGIVNISSNSSLHSDRDYEVGIEYMDDYNRCTTTLVDSSNTVYVPAEFSTSKNSIEVTIKNQPPDWATRYRLLMKPSKLGYEVIYANFYFYDSKDASWWLLLEGDNQTKCKVGDKLYVKSDSSGPTLDVVATRVLEIKALEANTFGSNQTGLYMKVRPSNFSIEEPDPENYTKNILSSKGSYPSVAYPVFFDDPDNPGTNIELPIPAGSKVRVNFRDKRNGRGDGCGSREYVANKLLVATQDYDNLYDLLIGENYDPSIPSNNPGAESSDDSPPTAEFIESFLEISSLPVPVPDAEVAKTKIQYVRGTGALAGQAWLVFRSGNKKCNGHRGKIYVGVYVDFAGDKLIFETEPLDNESETFFEGHKSYPIVNGYHTGDTQDQDASNDAVVSLDMFNCYSFGNGAESYKIGDNLATAGLTIGERVSAVSQVDYKEAHRYADITYSGIYNAETNLNNLNEFNLGLANYRTLEKLFGPINKLHGRQTDILVLQEDKISYLLAGKNLLSDSSGGGTLTSVPEVLGTQISRVEEFGISNDTESFTSYGYDIFFTDTKRGAVINLKGASANSDQLDVISLYGMRSWFRDTFTTYDNNFKLGCYDPYSQEYVLSFSDEQKEVEINEVSCGMNISQNESNNEITYLVNVSDGIGAVELPYDVTSGNVDIVVSYNGSDVIDTNITGTGTLTFDKDNVTVSQYTITLTPNDASYTLTIGCLQKQSLTVIKIVKNVPGMSGDTIHDEYFWSYDGFISETDVNYVSFGQGPVSSYQVVNGYESQGLVPYDGATITMRSNQQTGDLVVWDDDKFKYLVSDTLYTESDIAALSAQLTDVTGTINPSQGVYEGSFVYNNPNDYQYLYLVWDYIEPQLECNDSLDTEGSEGIYEVQVELGTNTGQTTITFDSWGIPDRFQVEWDGDIVADSLFVGDNLPNSGYENQITSTTSLPFFEYDGNNFTQNGTEPVNFSSSDIAVSDGSETRASGSGTGQIGVVADYPSSSALASDGNVKLMFNKTSAYPTTVKIIVIGINDESQGIPTFWSINDIECPTDTSKTYIIPNQFYQQTWTWKEIGSGDIGEVIDVVIINFESNWYIWFDSIQDLNLPILLSRSNDVQSSLSLIISNFETNVEGTLIGQSNYRNLDYKQYPILNS